jgi:NAD(P)-dependent dehydrogenase (short-subunit alcohol dehydrogenase family)
MIDLAGRTAVVTGGSRGIGRATAVLLARAGADVAVTYHSRRAEAEAVVAEITALGRRGFAGAAISPIP